MKAATSSVPACASGACSQGTADVRHLNYILQMHVLRTQRTHCLQERMPSIQAMGHSGPHQRARHCSSDHLHKLQQHSALGAVSAPIPK